MLTPQQLHHKYSTEPCTCTNPDPPYTNSTVVQSYGRLSPYGDGTPYNLLRIVNFFKHIKYPCITNAPGINSLYNGDGAIALTYGFLEQEDFEAYLEAQPTVEAGTSYAIRNCCALSAACHDQYPGRIATEYIQYLGKNSLPDCLMACGPDLVSGPVAEHYRAAGKKVGAGEPFDNSKNPASQDDPNGIYFTEALNSAGMTCFPGSNISYAGADHFCYTPPFQEDTFCQSCDPCPGDVTGNPNPDDPRCNKGTIWQANHACYSSNNGISSRAIFSTPSTEWFNQRFKHVGLLARLHYQGYADFRHQSIPKLGAPTHHWLDHFQQQNGWDYETNKDLTNGTISRARTISLILEASWSNRNLITQTNAQKNSMLSTVKNLLYNGYGVLLFSNIGFPNQRQSDGICYPDRIFYHTYNIIGYDDTKSVYDECVYILHSAFGDWISGGQPYWGDLPTGSFLVTETHLKAMISYSAGSDYFDCRSKICTNSPFRDCTDPQIIREYSGCPDPGTPPGPAGQSTPYYCKKTQSPFGLLIAISLTRGFEPTDLNHKKFIKRNLESLYRQQKQIYRG